MRRRFSLASLILLGLTVPAWAQGAVSNLKYPTLNSSIPSFTANVWQTVLAQVNSTRRSITIENNNLTDNCWLFIGSGTPTKPAAILLTPGGSYTRYYPYIPFDAIQATCASNGDTLYVDSQ